MNTRTFLACTACACTALAISPAFSGAQYQVDEDGYLSQDKGEPGRNVGERIPEPVPVQDLEGNEVNLNEAIAEHELTAVVIIQGDYNSACQSIFASYEDAREQFEEAGVGIIFITPEIAYHAQRMREREKSEITMYVDHTTEAMKAFVVAFRVPNRAGESLRKSVDQRRGYFGRDDLFMASGQWVFPASGSFLVDRKGTVLWKDCDWDEFHYEPPQRLLHEASKVQKNAESEGS